MHNHTTSLLSDVSESAKLDFVFNFQHSTRAFEHPGFILRLILDGSSIRYEPEFNDFEVVFLNIYDIIIKSVGIVPRVETKLYSDWVSLLRFTRTWKSTYSFAHF